MPVFNIEDFLERCLDSLSAQTLKEIEIIIVDDGSTDRSPEIISAYAARDARIVPIRQENRGLSGARNTGLDAASGKFVAFIDSDDWIENEMFEKMVNKAERDSADLCACDFTLAYPEGRFVRGMLELRDEKLEIGSYGLDRFWNGKKYSVVVWNKIYRRAIIEKHGLRFESNRNVFSEDVLFNLCFLKHVAVCSSVQGSYYYYFQRENSLMNSPKPDYLKRELFLVDRFREYYADYEDRAVYDNLMTRLFFERIQNACLHNLSVGLGRRFVRSELETAGRHPLFGSCMSKAARDREIWMPMRILARICRRRLYGSAAVYLRILLLLSNMRKRKRERARSAIAKSPQARII
ncbi:glycosyltransferase [Saccharibacillus sp. CPCC 101409]|uniref:glycosyltransferase n=1 Tax=Saccharibacillus sp. CPCC 101409 TaxID=3058041 RepID=UPI0026737395|nr:glycosyltransferase [Saccharibacillus sp. CPCC 101409]MDO3409403.1 glycosyltransferase [Saccharibacillus sp. CPCC 101409]